MEKAQSPFVYDAKNRKNRTVRVLKINRVVAVILFAAIVASLCITFLAINHSDSNKIAAKSFYFLQMGEFTSSGDALSRSLELKNSGGCGYVINDGVFRVMAAVYSSKSDANIVQNKLSEAGRDCKVFELKLSKLSLPKYQSKEETAVVRELTLFPVIQFFNQLFSQDMALDAGETTDSAVLLAAANLKNSLQDGRTQIVSLLSKYPADTLLNALEKTYSEILQHFQNYLPSTELTIETNLKTILCASVETYKTYTDKV